MESLQNISKPCKIKFPANIIMEIRVWKFQNYRDCRYTCNPHDDYMHVNCYREHFATQGFPALFMAKKFAVYPFSAWSTKQGRFNLLSILKLLFGILWWDELKNVCPLFLIDFSVDLHFFYHLRYHLALASRLNTISTFFQET